MLQFQALDETKHASNFLPSPKKESETLRVLRKARGYIAKGYCRYSRAMNRYGVHTLPWSDDSEKWCALGAIDAALNTGEYCGKFNPVVQALSAQVPIPLYLDAATTIAGYNNSTSQEAVLALFDKAIAAEEAKI